MARTEGRDGEENDTADTLDYKRMAMVVEGTFGVIRGLHD